MGEDVSLPTREVIRQLPPDGVYRYLGVFEADIFKIQMIKDRLVAEYKSRVRKLLQSYLNCLNIVQAINTYAMHVL